MPSVCVEEQWVQGGLSMVCRDGALGFVMCCGGGNGWHILRLVLSSQKKLKTGTLRVPWCATPACRCQWRLFKGKQCGDSFGCSFLCEKEIIMQFQNRGKETGVVKENLFLQGGIGKGYICFQIRGFMPWLLPSSFLTLISRIWCGWESGS